MGHAACRMAAFDTAAFIEEFRRRGVPREAFGDENLRTWAGAIPSPRQGVLQSVATVREAPFVPKDVRVAGAVLDETTGDSKWCAARPAGGAAPGAEAGDVSRWACERRRIPRRGRDARRRRASCRGERRAGRSRARRVLPQPPRSPRRTRPASLAKRATARARGGESAPPPPPRRSGAAARGAERRDRPAATSRGADARACSRRSTSSSPSSSPRSSWQADLENLRTELERRRDPRQRLELLDAFARRLVRRVARSGRRRSASCARRSRRPAPIPRRSALRLPAPGEGER